MPSHEHVDNELRERPLGEVAKALTRDVSLLVRQEIDLAKAEMAERDERLLPGLACSEAPGSWPSARLVR